MLLPQLLRGFAPYSVRTRRSCAQNVVGRCVVAHKQRGSEQQQQRPLAHVLTARRGGCADA